MEYWSCDALARGGDHERSASPTSPDGRATLTTFAVLPGWTAAHSVKIRGYVHPPISGTYVFTSCGHVALHLREHGQEAVDGAVLAPGERRSAGAELQAGRPYYIEAVCDGRVDACGMGVGWQLPDGTRVDVIDGTHLSPYSRHDGIPEEHEVLTGLSLAHPRILASEYDFAVLRARLGHDQQVDDWYSCIRRQAQEHLDEPVTTWATTDPYAANIAGRANQLILMMEVLGFVYNIERLGGDLALAQKCVDRAWPELEAASRFLHWDTEHFASTPRMAHAFAMAYDWLYEAFTTDQRAKSRKAIVELGLKKYADELDTGPFGWHQWTVMKGNWNCAINGDAGVALLAIAAEGDYLCEEVLRRLLVNVHNFSMPTYYPDGGTKEGPSYWQFKDNFFLPLLPALESALGTDFGLTSATGHAETGLFLTYSMGPSGQFFNYSDGHVKWGATPGLLYLARLYDTPLYAWTYRDRFADAISPRSVLWHDSRGTRQDLLSRPLDRYFSDAEVVYLRGTWDDDVASWVGFAATDNWDFLHGQLDQGTFVYDALGLRWAADLGSDNYGLPGFWDKDLGGARWRLYRNRAEGHNTLVINPGAAHEDQYPMAKGKMVAFEPGGDSPFAIADLSDAYRPSGARSVRRGVSLVGRRALIIRDEVTLIGPGEVWWFLHTVADITIAADGRSATLAQGGESVTVLLLTAPAEARLDAVEAIRLPSSPDPIPGESGGAGYRKLAIHIRAEAPLDLAVALMPDDVPAVGTELAGTRLSAWQS